jgi:hypothetical protein
VGALFAGFAVNFRAVILSEASAGFADAESKDPYSPDPGNAAEGLSGSDFFCAQRAHSVTKLPGLPDH